MPMSPQKRFRFGNSDLNGGEKALARSLVRRA
jgi:hypothetical protein